MKARPTACAWGLPKQLKAHQHRTPAASCICHSSSSSQGNDSEPNMSRVLHQRLVVLCRQLLLAVDELVHSAFTASHVWPPETPDCLRLKCSGGSGPKRLQ